MHLYIFVTYDASCIATNMLDSRADTYQFQFRCYFIREQYSSYAIDKRKKCVYTFFLRSHRCVHKDFVLFKSHVQAKSPHFANGSLPPLPVNLNCQVASAAGRCWRPCVRFYRVCRTHCAVRGVLSNAVSRLSNAVTIFQ